MERVAIAVGALALAAISLIYAPHEASAAQYGKASYYWQPQALASGGRFNPNAMSAAHKTLPFGTKVRVTRRSTGRSVVVTINDRGPYIRGRIIDLSLAAARKLGMTKAGVTAVRVDVIGRGNVRHLALGRNGGKYGGNFKSKKKKKVAALTKKAVPAKKSVASEPAKKVAALDKKADPQVKSAKNKLETSVAAVSKDAKSDKKRSVSQTTKSVAAVSKKTKLNRTTKTYQKRKTKRKAKTVASLRKKSKSRRVKKQKFAGIPKSLRNKRIISVKRRYTLNGKTRTTSGRIPSGATLLREEITYYN